MLGNNVIDLLVCTFFGSDFNCNCVQLCVSYKYDILSRYNSTLFSCRALGGFSDTQNGTNPCFPAKPVSYLHHPFP